MTKPLEVTYAAEPSALAYMARAFVPGAKAARPIVFPALTLKWSNYRFPRDKMASFHALTGLDPAQGLTILGPHVFGFRLIMALLTHRAFPLPLWGALQIRNHLTQLRPLPAHAALDFATDIGAWRVLEKGVEVDVRTRVHAGGEAVWESVNTFYYRGRFGAPQAPSPLAASPRVEGAAVSELTVDRRVGWDFGKLTGDYNGIHLWRWYARRFGFRDAFHHPQLVLAKALAGLSRGGRVPLRLDAWLKGPVYYGARLALIRGESAEGTYFALQPADDARPAIVGRLLV
jgi:hypothetical protein